MFELQQMKESTWISLLKIEGKNLTKLYLCQLENPLSLFIDENGDIYFSTTEGLFRIIEAL